MGIEGVVAEDEDAGASCLRLLPSSSLLLPLYPHCVWQRVSCFEEWFIWFVQPIAPSCGPIVNGPGALH